MQIISLVSVIPSSLQNIFIVITHDAQRKLSLFLMNENHTHHFLPYIKKYMAFPVILLTLLQTIFTITEYNKVAIVPKTEKIVIIKMLKNTLLEYARKYV